MMDSLALKKVLIAEILFSKDDRGGEGIKSIP